MSLENPLWLEAVTGDAAITYSARQDRTLFDMLVRSPGVSYKGDLLVAQRAAGANLSVDVAAGVAAASGNSVAYQGTYLCRSTSSVNVPMPATPASGTRTDLVVAQVYDKQADGGTQYAWTPLGVQGTTVPANAITLAQVARSSTEMSILNSAITDKRLLNGLGDVPTWDYSGTVGPQSIPSGTETVYVPNVLFEQTGVGTTSNPGEVVCQTPGRYVVHFGCRFNPGGVTAIRAAFIVLFDVNGTTRLRRINNAYETANYAVLTTAGTIRMRVGQMLSPRFYQNSGAALTVTDSSQEMDFTGVWTGP